MDPQLQERHRNNVDAAHLNEEREDVYSASAMRQVPLRNTMGVSATQSMKNTALDPNIEGTGNVSHAAVANELGLPTRTQTQHDALQQRNGASDSSQNVVEGNTVAHNDAADTETPDDPSTINTWSHPEAIPEELVPGLENEELYKIIRRFNKQMYHVKACADGSMRGLYPEREMDLVNAASEFTPDRLRSNAERFYISFVVSSAAVAKHIARIRSWNEYNRTFTWCAVYFLFWLAAQTGLLLTGFLMALIVYPPSRNYLFPPAPLAMMSVTSGGLQRPHAGNTVGSKDSLAGAGEVHKGEAVENEATTFVNGIGKLAVQAEVSNSLDGVGDMAKDGKSRAKGESDDMRDKRKREDEASGNKKQNDPVANFLWMGLEPALQALEDFCDNSERFANALNPAPPMPQHLPRIKLAALLAPILLATLFFKAQWISRFLSFSMGLLFFSQPYMTRGWRWFTKNYPNWRELIQLQNTLLAGVPSNSQLALMLLRLAEDDKKPLPPPPSYDNAPPRRSVTPELEEDLPPVNADTAVEDLSANEQYNGASVTDTTDDTVNGSTGGGKRKKLMGLIKGTGKTGVRTALAADRVKAAFGSEAAKERRGVLDKSEKYADGPSTYRCRYEGDPGWLIISTTATTPCISWVRDGKKFGNSDPPATFSVQIEDIKELKKLGGLGWKSKLLVSNALGMNIIDSLAVTTRTGESINVTALPRREELFNRLIALSQNRWDSY